MAMNFKASVFGGIQVQGDQVGDISQGLHFDLSPAPLIRQLVAGTLDYQLQRVFCDTRTLALSTGEDLDLVGSLLGVQGVAVTFATVKALYVKAAAENTNNVQIKPGAATGFLGPFNAAADQVTLRPGDVFLATALKAGWAVVGGTNDLLHIHNSGAGTSVDYDIVIIGT